MQSGREWWLPALLLFVAGDIGLTWAALQLGAWEAHPVSQVLISELGFWLGAAAGKGVAVALIYVLWRLMPPPHCRGLPIGLTVAGVLVTAWNGMILTALIVR